MQMIEKHARQSVVIVAGMILCGGSGIANGAVLTTLVSFNNPAASNVPTSTGASPSGGLIADANGDLFGTTSQLGPLGQGTVFEIIKTGSSYGGITTLASFNNANGADPEKGLIADAAGNLFGTTFMGGASGYGTVFEIAKTGSSYGNITLLASFNVANGQHPDSVLMADAAGNLFGTTTSGGASGSGTVFEISKTGSSYGSVTTLASFNNTNGGNPRDGLIADAAGNLFGTASSGGTSGNGIVFEIPKTGSSYGAVTTLATFNGVNGAQSNAGLVADGAGNLFGTASSGGTSANGTVFEIAKTGSSYGSITTLATFTNVNEAQPDGALILDAAGNLFGTTFYGGAFDSGSVFELVKTGSDYGTATTLASFNGVSTGAYAIGALLADTSGNLFGATVNGGPLDGGTVFMVSNTGFVTSAVTGVPEPSSVVLLGVGLVTLVMFRNQRLFVSGDY